MNRLRVNELGITNGRVKLFTGGVFSINPKTFIKANGYPNNIAGWGIEDHAFGLRINRLGNIIFQAPQNGRLIDLENETITNITDKLKLLNQKKLKFDDKWELQYLDQNNWIKDGINSMDYMILESKKNEIIVKVSSSKINYKKLNMNETKLKNIVDQIDKKHGWVKIKII